MRAVLSLAVINAVVWGAFIAFFPGTHFAWPGSYRFWWFDDVPWAVLIVSVVVPVLLATSHFKKVSGFKSGSIVVLTIILLGILPYAACSGGGV
jgi:hypothetical protein